MNARVAVPAVVALVSLGALVLAQCDGGKPRGAPPSPPAANAAKPHTYTFTWRGKEADMTWNRALWLTARDGGKASPAVPLIFFEDEELARAEGHPGGEWSVCSEETPNRAMRAVMHMIEVRGTFGDPAADPAAASITIHVPPRALVALTGREDADPGPDILTAADESGARLVARRDVVTGLELGVWDASKPEGKQDPRFGKQQAPTRPWTYGEIREGVPLVLAAKTGGRQWMAVRATLKAGETLTLDVAARPQGGGTVVCDDPCSELLLDGELPIPAARLVLYFLRARWENVPPGRHKLRHGDGRVVDLDVKDGEELKVGR